MSKGIRIDNVLHLDRTCNPGTGIVFLVLHRSALCSQFFLEFLKSDIAISDGSEKKEHPNGRNCNWCGETVHSSV